MSRTAFAHLERDYGEMLERADRNREWLADQHDYRDQLDHSTGEAMEQERAVLVTTLHKGVFFGYATDTSGSTIKLRAGRNCIYWPIENRGFLGLANMGPVNGARVGPPADIELRDITSVAEVTPTAVTAWEKSPW